MFIHILLELIQFVSADTNNGWYVRWTGMDNYIYSTTDGGITWEYQRS